MYCSPDVQVVCTVLGATVCRKYPCGIDAAAAPAATASTPTITCAPGFEVVCEVLGLTLCRKTGCPIDVSGEAAASPALYCAPTLQDLQCVVDEILHPCQTRCAASTAAAASPASTRIDCDITLVCEVLALTVCRHGCALELSGAAAAPARLDSPPGDPCSRQWPWPIETVCHL
jgi:hypothetical protein